MAEIDVQDFDYLAGGSVQAQDEAARVVADTSSIIATGTSSEILGFNSGGTPEPKTVGGNGFGFTLAFSGNQLRVNSDQDLRTTGAPTFANLTLSGVGGLVDIIATRKSNLSAAVAPTANDDSGDGYSVGSFWIDVALDDAYICCDSTLTAAVWKKITP